MAWRLGRLAPALGRLAPWLGLGRMARRLGWLGLEYVADGCLFFALD
jgi:hypothetical protein